MKKEHPVHLGALFLGPKSENIKFLKETLMDLIDEHAYWRKDFHPEDKAIITIGDQQEKQFKDTEQKILETLQELSAKLRTTSMPWHSPRYLGHMNTDILVPAILGYVGAMLYNPNNVAYEASTATSPMELEVGMDFARLMGFDMGKAWGHICTDGSVANLEGLWYARNIASIPFAVKQVKPDLVKGMAEWELANMTVPAILDLAARVKDVWEEIRNHSVRGTGVIPGQLGKWIVPQSKHYSWVKAGEISGIGLNHVVNIQVDNNFRMDMKILENTINDLAAKKIPVLGVVGVLGTTEEGAVDHFDQIIALRRKFEQKGISFYVHADMAYGGYARSIFLDETFSFMPYNNLKARLHKEDVIDQDSVDWPSREIYDAFQAVSEANSITIDPHKMGYVPYAAGGIVVSDRRMLDAISFFAAYVFEKGMDIPSLLGSYILEGSKAGATAAGVWVAHRVLPMNMFGYGRLIGASVETAQRTWTKINELKFIDVNGTRFRIEALVKPDFNMVDFAFNYEGNTDLGKMNQLNLDIYNLSSYVSGPVLKNDFITSHTVFSHDDYGDAPADLAGRLGIPFGEWKKIGELRVMRACIMTPYLVKDEVARDYWNDYLESMKRKLGEIIQKK